MTRTGSAPERPDFPTTIVDSRQDSDGPAGPPPLPKAVSYYVAMNGTQAGPFEVNALPDKVTTGQLKRDTLVWTTGMPQWTAAGLVPELKSLFENSPPPLPPVG